MPPPPSIVRDFRVGLCAVFVLALLLRLLHVASISSAPIFLIHLGDSAIYHRWATEIAGGEVVGSGVFWYAPLYPYFLGLVYALFGDGGLAVRLIQAVIGAASAVLLADATRHWFSARSGIVAGALLAVYAPALFYDGLVHKPVLELALLSLTLWIVARWGAGGLPPRAALLLGAALGLLALARENTLVFVPVLVVWVVGARWPRDRKRMLPPAMLLVGLLLTLGPVALRNRLVGGEFHLTGSNFGYNLYAGNNERADGSYVPLLALRGSPEFEREDATRLAEQALGRALTPSEISDYWASRALEFIRSRPVDWARLVARKTFLFWHATELADAEDPYTHARWSPVLRATLPLFHLGLLAPLAFLGLLATRERWRALWPLHVMLALYPATVIAFFVFGRYRYPVVALLVPFAAAGLVEGLEYLRKASGVARLVTGVVVVFIAAACNWPDDARDRARAVTLQNIGIELAAQPDRLDEAIGYYEAALRLRPDSVGALHNLANALERRGEFGRAEALYREALRHAPALGAPRNNLGRLLEAQGRVDEAIECYRLACASDPLLWEAQSNLGLLLSRQGSHDAAIETLQQAIRQRPDDATLRYNLGNVLIPAGRVGEAVEQYRAALALEPRDPRIHNNLGYALTVLGRLDEAIASYRAAVAIDPDYAAARRNLEAALEAVGNPGDGRIR